jgi:hypothetical protein
VPLNPLNLLSRALLRTFTAAMAAIFSSLGALAFASSPTFAARR